MDNQEEYQNRYGHMNILQQFALIGLERAAERVRAMTGGMVWLSVGLPTGEQDEHGRGMALITYAVGCDCPVCSKANGEIVQGIQDVVERVASIDGKRPVDLKLVESKGDDNAR
jgi:hypothetical protein